MTVERRLIRSASILRGATSASLLEHAVPAARAPSPSLPLAQASQLPASKIGWPFSRSGVLGALLLVLLLISASSATDLEPQYSIHWCPPGPGPDKRICGGDRFGWAVAALGQDRFVIGVPHMEYATAGPEFGRVYIYEKRLTSWPGRARVDHPFPAEGDRFGHSIASIGSGFFVVGAPYRDKTRIGPVGDPPPPWVNTGIVYLFDRDGNYLRSITNPSHGSYDVFGNTLAGIGSSFFLVGVPEDDPGGIINAGTVYLYDVSGQLLRTIDNPDPDPSDRFGFSMASIDTERFVVGAPFDEAKGPKAGWAYLFSISDPELQQDLTPNTVNISDNFGYAMTQVGVGGFAISAPQADVTTGETIPLAGKVFLYDTNANWIEIPHPDPIAYAGFGLSLATVGTNRFLVRSARAKSVSGNEGGVVYLYDAAGTLLAVVKNPSPALDDLFGLAMAGLGEEHFVITAPGDDTHKTNAGSAYIYHASILEYVLGGEIAKPQGPPVPENGPSVEPDGLTFWHGPTKRLYATGPGNITINWTPNAQDPLDQVTVQGLNIWPTDPNAYQMHVANTPLVDLTSGGDYAYAEQMAQDDGVGTDADQVRSSQLFGASGPGKTLLMFSDSASPQAGSVYFQVIRTVTWDDPSHLDDNVPTTIGAEVMDENYHDRDAGSPYAYWLNSHYLPDSADYPGYYDRQNRTGPIIPVNLSQPQTVEDDLVVVYYEKGAKALDGDGSPADSSIYWPWKPVRCQAEWPVNPEKIIIANLDSTTRLSIDARKHHAWEIYYQNDPSLPGFNPNDEQAIRRPWGAGEAIFPLRDDLGTPQTSEPYVLMTYQDADDGLKPKVKVFKVVAKEAPHFFIYGDDAGDPGDDIFAGTLIQAPFPLSVLQKCQESHGVSGPYWRDRKLDFWAKAAGDDGSMASIVMRYFYPVQIGFYFPETYYDPQDGPPAPGTHVPWLDLRAGTPGTPHDVTYVIQWPVPPELSVVETLVKPKHGLPDISLQSSVEIVYQQSVALGTGPSVLLIDPVREHEVDLTQLPPDVEVVNEGGTFFFPTLPPHLRNRFTYDPINRKLEFRGEFIEPPAGDYYLLLNVITDREKAVLIGLSNDAAFQGAVNSLAAQASQVVEVTSQSTGFDSLALTAGFAEGTGYVVLAFGNSTTLTPEPDPISLEVIQVSCPIYQGEIKVIESDNPFDEKLTLRHSGDFAGRTDEYVFEWRMLPPDPTTGLPYTAPPDQWAIFSPVPASGQGAVDITIEGPGLLTLSDNYFICRYQPTSSSNPCGTSWSDWTDPMLAEGWIKRVLKGINPFEQKIQAYRDNQVNTIVSMISQAGPRWVGNVPLNLQGAEEFGLIEVYETVLKRGMGLSIDGAPPVDYPPANDALLLAAGRLADLYMLLGNEAYADGSDPTIAYGTNDGVYGAEASSIHCFMNQTASLLEEELALFRGRDDALLPSIDTYPIYNRLIWNFTGDINGGEVAYALNYNIRNENGDVAGTIDEADAKELYPQGHGDAWGHYLTAIKNYYRLLQNPNFSWVPRIEAVLVGGVPVSVDFIDERKFAQAAAAKARSGAEIVNLTYRSHYVEDPEGQYQGYLDSDAERAWGLSEWAGRAGQGALFDWVVGNAMLPEIDPTLADVDPNNDHTGIQVVDRRTVTELREIPARFQDIQAQLDMADIGLNPLGLTKNVVPFDIDPSAISQGKTHFEQIYERVVKAMNNAIAVFNHANNATQLLRRQADTVGYFQQAVEDREADFNSRLIEIFGYPYADDIGPTGTYPTGYDGPDIYHYDYVDPTALLGEDPPPVQTLTLEMGMPDVSDEGNLARVTQNVTFHIATTGLGMIKPGSWTGKRRAPGEIQMARSELLQTKARFEKALLEYENLINQIEDQADLLRSQYAVNLQEIAILDGNKNTQAFLNDVIVAKRALQVVFRTGGAAARVVAEAGAVAIEVNPFDKATMAVRLVGEATSVLLNTMADVTSIMELESQQAKENAQLQTNLELTTLHQQQPILQQIAQLEQLIRQEPPLAVEIFTLVEAVAQAGERYAVALARGQRLLQDRLRFRQQTAAQIQEYRYKDMAFRIFRNDALQKYRAQFDLAARYVYLAAKAYDYETNLMEGDPRGPGEDFMTDIIRSRSIGLIQNGLPLTGAGTGDPGLADPLARMFLNWDLVLKGQLGFNNPQTETGRFSLRSELFRVQPGFQGQAVWRETLARHVQPNLLDLPEFQRYCIPFQPQEEVEPAIVIPFSTTINFGLNFFGWPAGGGDNDYDSTHFATKIRSVGVWFANYNNLGSGMINTPRIYLIPVGMDIMRSPSSQTGETREWRILDQALPVPFPLSGGDLNNPDWIPLNDTLVGDLADIRRYARFRAYHDSGSFNPAETISDSRLIGRSVWNTRWLLIIPAGTLHGDRQEALARFIHGRLLPNGERDGNGVTDIKIFFQTYAYSGN